MNTEYLKKTPAFYTKLCFVSILFLLQNSKAVTYGKMVGFGAELNNIYASLQ